MSTASNQDFQQAPGAGFTSNDLRGSGQGEDRGYDQMAKSQKDEGMGGGYGAHGSGVAGGYEGNQAQGQQGGQGVEKQDWLDKGIQAGGKKFGMNIVSLRISGASRSISHTETFDYRAKQMLTRPAIS